MHKLDPAKPEDFETTDVEYPLQAGDMIHWEQGVVITKYHRHQYLYKVLENPKLNRPEHYGNNITADEVRRALIDLGVRQEDLCALIDHTTSDSPPIMQSPGRWFSFIPREATLESINRVDMSAEADVKQAFHGTALHNLPVILKEGLVEGFYGLSDSSGGYLKGVYCEGKDRLGCTLNYMTHTHVVGHRTPLHMWSVLLELLVDRSQGKKRNDQWILPREAVHLSVVHIHICNLRNMYDEGYRGWYRVQKPSIEAIKVCENPSAIEAAINLQRKAQEFQ